MGNDNSIQHLANKQGIWLAYIIEKGGGFSGCKTVRAGDSEDSVKWGQNAGRSDLRLMMQQPH
jgi:hypothetical protein